MNVPNIATAVLASLIAISAAATAETKSEQQNSGQSAQGQNGEASAHGYKNPAGPDPDPRMTEQAVDRHGQDEQEDGAVNDVTREGSEQD